MKKFQIKRKKFWAINILGFSIIAPIAVVSISSTTSAMNQKGKILIFQGKAFLNYKGALEYYLANHKGNIGKKSVVGSIDESIIDNKFNILDKNKLPNYKTSNIKFLYKANNGLLVKELSKARQSFTIHDRRRYSFAGARDVYMTREEAEIAAQRQTFNQVTSITKVSDPHKREFNINSTNKEDIEYLRTELKKTFQNYSNKEDFLDLEKILKDEKGDKNGWDLKFIEEKSPSEYKIINKKNWEKMTKKPNIKDSISDILGKYISVDVKKLPFGGKFNAKSAYYDVDKGVLNINGDLNIKKQLFNFKEWNGWGGKTDWVEDDLEVLLSGNTNPLLFHYSELKRSVKGLKHYLSLKNKDNAKWKYENSSSLMFSIHRSTPFYGMLLLYEDKIMGKFSSVTIGGEDFHGFKLKLSAGEPINTFNFDLSNAQYVILQSTGDAGGAYYNHKAKAESLQNIKFSIKCDIDYNDLILEPLYGFIHSLKKKGKLKKIITYNDNPVFKIDSGKLTNISFMEIIGDEVKINQNLKDVQELKKLSSNGRLRDIENYNNQLVRKSLQSSAMGWSNIYRQYIHALSLFLKNTKKSNTLLKEYLNIEDVLYLKNSKNNNVSRYVDSLVYNNKVFNRSLHDYSSLPDGMNELKNEFKIKNDRKKWGINVVLVWVFYDEFGNLVGMKNMSKSGLYDNSLFDNLELTKKNLINIKNVEIDHDYIRVEKPNGGFLIVKNQINDIYSFQDGYQKLYFKTFNNLKSYLLDFIKVKSFWKKI